VQAWFGIVRTAFKIELMKILLQHVRTQLYLQSPGKWTANPFEALDFQHSQTAIDFAREHRIDGIQIAVTFVDRQFDEVVALPPIHPAPGKRAD
jgi:hypothetical protein